MKAVKGNKEYTIGEAQKEQYVKSGFDIYEGGECIQEGLGKSVPVEKLRKVEAENAALRAELDKLREAEAENAILRAEIEKR